MTSSQTIHSAQILLEQGRHQQAEEMLRQGLYLEANHPMMLVMLAVALLGQEKMEAAEDTVRRALAEDPEMAYGFYVLSLIQLNSGQGEAALITIDRAVSLDPLSPELHALKASVYVENSQWQKAEKCCRQGLSIDPQHIGCLNILGIVLNAQGKIEESTSIIQLALSRDPNRADSHNMMGWTMLRANQPKAALASFQESLRINPNLENAREGLIKALNARNPVFRMLLQYFFKMSSLTGKQRWLVVLGALFLVNLISQLGKSYPVLEPLVLPVLGLYLFYVVLSWSGNELFNLMLRFHPIGKLALSKSEKQATTVVAFLLGGGLLLGGIGWWFQVNPLLWGGGGLASLFLPFSAYNNAAKASQKRLKWLVLAAGTALAIAVIAGFMGSSGIFNGAIFTFVVTYVSCLWAANLWSD